MKGKGMYCFLQKERGGFNFRWLINYKNVLEISFNRFYCTFGISIGFPSEWHEDKQMNISIDLLWLHIYIGLPWYGKIAPDYGQCSGPRYGFQFFEDILFIYHGQDTENPRYKGGSSSFYLPTHWEFVEHKILSEPETYDYTYVLKSGEIQKVKATIFMETREWKRNWFPSKKIRKTIDVMFSSEVGERSGSWKGGTIGCSYEMLPNESPYATLRRMEQERKL